MTTPVGAVSNAILVAMDGITQKFKTLNLPAGTPHRQALDRVRTILTNDLGYRLVHTDEDRPWGAFYQIADEEADRFLADFFPGLDPLAARLGQPDLVVSPKILVVYPNQRLSWQYHTRRAERWHFLTPGGYYKSPTDDQGVVHTAAAGENVQFTTGERHRLSGSSEQYTLVAEIWQHTAPSHPSDESDIVRLADDYKR